VQGREPYTARLNGRYGLFFFVSQFILFYSLFVEAWRPAYMDADQFLYIDLGSRYYVTSVATQGRRAAKEYVTIYNVMYSDNGHNWFYYTNEDNIIVVCFEENLFAFKFLCFYYRILLGIEMIMKL
jgi:hypothetical protein